MRFPHVVAQAADEGLLVLVPQSVSLTTTAVSAEDVSHHVLRPTDVRGEFSTLSGRSVTLVGSQVIAGRGFPREVVAKLLSHDTVDVTLTAAPSSEGTPTKARAGTVPGAGTAVETPRTGRLRVYFISRPLDGGMAAPGGTDDMDHGTILRYVAMLRAAPETESVFSELDAAVTRASAELRVPRPPGTPMPRVERALAAACHAAADALLSASYSSGEDGGAGAGSARDAQRRQLLQISESVVMERLHSLVLPALEEELAPVCARLGATLARLAGHSQADMGIKALFRGRFDSVVAILGLLHASVTPLEKLHCLRDTTLTLMRCVEAELERRAVDLADVDLATDDIIDILLYVVVAGAEHHPLASLPAHLEYATRFRLVGEEDGENSRLSYFLANFQQVVCAFDHLASKHEAEVAAIDANASSVGTAVMREDSTSEAAT